MSLIQSEKDVLRDGRQELGKEATVPLRDQVVRKLYKKLEEDGLGKKLKQAWHTSSTAIDQVLKKQQDFLADLDNFSVSDASPQPFGGTSNIHLPAAFIVCKSYHARFLEALLGIDPPFSMKARREDGTDRVGVCEDLMRYALSQWANNYKGIEEVVDPWLWNWCTTGTGILKTRWKTDWEYYTDVKDVYVPLKPLTQFDANGQRILIPQWKHEEKEVEEKKKVFSGPQYDLVNIEDFRMIGGAGDPDRADIVMQRTYVTASELWTKADQGVYDTDCVEEVIEKGKSDPLFDDTSGLKQQRKIASGEQSFTDDTHLDRYQIVEACLRYDVNGSGITSDIVVTFEMITGSILHATYLRRIMPSGERPYSVIHFHKRPGETYGLGLLEILAPLTTELDTMHNIRIDNALFESQPFYIYRNSASFDANEIVIEPGMGIGVDNIGDIVFPQLPPRTSFTANEEQVVQSYIERLTGISDISLGVMTGTQGPTRTASGVKAILGENNNNLSVHLRRLNKGWTKVLRSTWHMLQNRVEPGFAFRITGNDGKDVFRRVSDIDLALDADFELSANTSNSNKAVQIELNQQLVSMTMNPLNIQLGITGPGEIYSAQKAYLNSLGLKDVHRYLKKPEGYAYTLTPEEELSRIIRGERVAVAPQQDHDGFVAFASAMLEQQQEPGRQVLDAKQQSALIEQMKAHQQMKAALEQQAAQQAQLQQLQFNQANAGPSFTNQRNSDPGQLF